MGCGLGLNAHFGGAANLAVFSGNLPPNLVLQGYLSQKPVFSGQAGSAHLRASAPFQPFHSD